jgi:hypothetical protein
LGQIKNDNRLSFEKNEHLKKIGCGLKVEKRVKPRNGFSLGELTSMVAGANVIKLLLSIIYRFS